MLLLLCCCQLIAFAGGGAFYSKVTVTAKPSGAGKVYADTSSIAPAADKYQDTFTTPVTKGKEATLDFYLFAQPTAGNDFLGWLDKSGSVLSTSNPYTAQVTSTSADEKAPFEATFTAKFGKTLVTVASADAKLGSVSIDKLENKLGDNVVLTATPVSSFFGNKFTGWSIEGSEVIVSTSKTYTVNVTAKAKYIAHFESNAPNGGRYYHVFSKTSNKYVWMVGDTYTATNSEDGFRGAIFLNSIVLHPKLSKVYSSTPSEEYASSAGTVVYITGNPNASGGLNKVDIVAQGVGSQSIIKKAGYNVEIIAESTPAGTTKFYGNMLGKRYLKDGVQYGGRVGNSAILCGGDDNNQYELQPLDEDHMNEFYFGAAPKTQAGGKYYTTMYTAFPYKCHDGVKAYIVTKVDAKAAKITIREIENGEVPAKTPVILECQTDKPATNRLVPMTTQAASIDGNLLKGVIDINHNAGNDDYRTKFDPATMRVLAADGFKFGKTNTTGDNVAYIATNTCYLPLTPEQAAIENYDIVVAGEVEPITPITLEALTDRVTKEKIGQYAHLPVAIVDEDLTCVFAKGKWLYVKDDNKALVKDLPGDDDIDYMAMAGFGEAAHYDQSNWAVIILPDSKESAKYVGKKLKGVVGNFHVDVGIYIEASKNPVAGAENKNYVIKDKINDLTDNINTYCMASFAGTQVSPVNNEQFFFVTPKNYEVADITWAVWNKEKKAFVIPAKQGPANRYNLDGAVKVLSFRFNEGVRNYDDLQDGVTYEFRAIIRKAKNLALTHAPAVGKPDATIANDYVILPLTLSSASIITAVDNVEAGKAVASVRYINMQGMSSDKPFAGMNVVVTTYSDGSRTTTKEMH